MATADEIRLIDAWDDEVLRIRELAYEASLEQWQSATRLAGWSVADIVAHVVDIESILSGEPRPDHEPNWSALPHVDDDIARFTEVGVDARRTRSREELLAEFDDVHARLVAHYRGLPDNAAVPSATGRIQPLTRVLSMRCFDLWVHEQDLRAALGLPGNYESEACKVTLQKSLELAAAKWAAQNPSPGTLTVTLTTPEWASAAHDFGGEGASLEFTSTAAEFLDLTAGRSTSTESRWSALVVAP